MLIGDKIMLFCEIPKQNSIYLATPFYEIKTEQRKFHKLENSEEI